MHHFSINPLTLRFTSRDLEAAYRSDFFQKTIRQIRLAVLLAIALYAGFGFLDPWMAPHAKAYLWGIRGVICVLWTGVYFFTYVEPFKRYYQTWLFLILLSGGMGILAMMAVAGDETEWFYYGGLILVTMYAAVFKIRVPLTFALSVLLILTYNAIVLLGDQTVPTYILVNNNFFLISAGIITLFAAYAIEHTARLVFWQTRVIDEQREAEREKAEEIEQAYLELREAQAQLVQQEKLASLGQLTAGIAHEIKNPLNFVNNFALLSTELLDELTEALSARRQQPVEAVLEEVTDLLSDLRFNAAKIEEHGRRADAIVRAMLQHARSTPGERQATDLNALLEEYVNLAYHGMRAATPGFNVTLERDYDAGVGEVDLVREEIGRVFLNLLGNAFYAVHERALETEGPYMPTVRASTRRVDEAVEVRIADNGPGVPKDFRKKIFEPFFTTKPAGSGTGLGLSLAYDIVTQGHGGTLRVAGDEGQGATFVVTLPVDPQSSAR